MALGKKKENDIIEPVEPMENNVALSDIVETEEEKQFFEPVTTVSTSIGKPSYLIGYVAVDRSFLRQEADKYSDIIAFLNKNQGVVVNTEGSTDDFYYVTADYKNGYVVKTDIAFNS